MDNSIKVNNMSLGEYLREKEDIDLEIDIKSNNVESRENHNLYQKPRLKLISKKEKNGKVKNLQNEVNYLNREQLAIEALSKQDLKAAIIYWIIGSYKEEKIITRSIATQFERIIKENDINLVKYNSVFAAMRNIMGAIKKTEFGVKYLTHIRNFQTGNYFLITDDGLNLKPEIAIELASKIVPKSQIKKTIKSNKPLDLVKQENDLVEKINNAVDYAPDCEKQNDILDKLGIDLNKIASNGLTINLFGPINIHIK